MRYLSLVLLFACSETGTLTVVGGEPVDTVEDSEPDTVDPTDTTEPADSDPDSDVPVDSDEPDAEPPNRDRDGDGVRNVEDCEPDDASIYPGAPEDCNNVDDNCDGEVDERGTCPCPTDIHANTLYMVCPAFVSWTEARDACERVGMDLVIVDDQAENAFVRNADIGSIDVIGINWWIGLSDIGTEGTFTWVDGSGVSYENWRPDEPNNAGQGEDCVEMRTLQAGWNDTRCGEPHPFICEAR